LRDWLDPTNSGLTTVNAMQPVGPPNDTCNQFSVPEISTLPYSTSGTTKWAVDNYSIGGCSNNTAPDVAYSLRLNCDYNVTVSLCGSSYDTRLYIVEYYWCAPNGTPATYCNDDFCGLQSQVSFTAHANTWYAIWVDGYGSASGDFVLNITGTANSYANQSCPGEAITEVPYSTILDTECSGDNFTPTCQPNDAEDVVYNFVSPYHQPMRVRTCAGSFDTILELREWGACPGTFLTACSDDASCGSNPLASQVVIDPSVGSTYYIHVDGYGGQTGFSTLEIEAYNDDCTSPYVVTGLPFNDYGDTRAARDDYQTIPGFGSKEVFFQYTSPICQNMGVSLCAETFFDSYVEVRTGGDCPGSTLVASNDDFCGLASQTTWSAETNRTYYIIVTGFSDVQEGPFSIKF
ncbi:MAG: hypothetical protein IPP40_15000, partial [bacterium]|nr:hypothetical protein [bacterium]